MGIYLKTKYAGFVQEKGCLLHEHFVIVWILSSRIFTRTSTHIEPERDWGSALLVMISVGWLARLRRTSRSKCTTVSQTIQASDDTAIYEINKLAKHLFALLTRRVRTFRRKPHRFISLQ